MSTMTLTKQYIFDDAGHPIAVLLPIAEYYKLIRSQLDKITSQQEQPDHPLYGALRHLGGSVASTEELDETRRELWAAWDREEGIDLKGDTQVTARPKNGTNLHKSPIYLPWAKAQG